jgi:hypothetical protein
VAWVAHTNSWTLETGTSIWLMGDSSYPPNGIELPILLIDGALVMSTVISASPSKIVLELNHYRRSLIPAAPNSLSDIGKFPGSEWILGPRLKGRAPVGF